MITAIWSDDPEFYNAILGGKELLGHIFIKNNNGSPGDIIHKFGLEKISEEIFTKSDRNKYICMVTNKNVTETIKVMEETIKSM